MDWVLLGIPVGIVMLYFGSDWLVKGAKGLALRLGISAFVVGLTVVAFGSSAPECVTSLVSSETPEIIIGNVVGSNIVNIGLAIGLAAMISPLAAKYLSMRFEVIMMMVASLVVVVMSIGGFIGFVEGLILCSALVVFVFLVYYLKKGDAEGQEAYTSDVEEGANQYGLPRLIVMCVLGLVFLYYGARFFIDGATELATIFGVSELLIGLIVVAVGTSLPEICICLMAAYRKESDLAVANIVGSNIFNLFFVLGVGALIVDIPISETILTFHFPVMLLMSALMFVMIRFNNRISRPMGAVLVAIYVAYLATMAMVPSLTI